MIKLSKKSAYYKSAYEYYERLERRYGVMKMERSEVEKAIKVLLDKYHAECAILFGSYAREDETAGSDIDVIVIGGVNFRPKDIFAFGEELRQITKKKVDAFEIREENEGTKFYENIMREGARIA